MNAYKSVVISLIILAFAAGCCTSKKPTSPIVEKVQKTEDIKNVEITKHVQDATVAFVIGQPGEKTPYCAGVWVDSEHILTAAHCAEILGRTVFSVDEKKEYNPIGDIAVFVNHGDLRNGEIPQDFSWIGIIEKIDKEHDLALVKSISGTSHHTIALLAVKDIQAGELVHTMGHPIGLLWTYTRGVVAAIRNSTVPILGDQLIQTKVIQVSAPIWAGNSGGGAFNTDGHLIGLCSWITLRAPNIGFFIHRDEIKNFLSSR
jgi:hypothetical protein